MNVGSRKYLSCMVVILLLVFAIGARGLNLDPIWADELYSLADMGVFESHFSPVKVVEALRQRAPDHSPLYFLLGATWAQFVGWSQYSLRLLSLLAGLLMIAWLYRFALAVANRDTAVIAALLMSTSAFVIFYFHEIRMYSLLMLLVAIHIWFYFRTIQSKKVTLLSCLLLVLSTAALTYTHSLSLFYLLGLGTHHLLFVRRSRNWLRILLALGIGVAFCLPYVPTWERGILLQSANDRGMSSPEVATALSRVFVNGMEVLWLPLLLVIAYALFRYRASLVWRLLSVELVMLVSILLLNASIEFIPVTRMRYFLLLWIPFTVLLAFALQAFTRVRLLAVLFVLMWGTSGYAFLRSSEILEFAGIVTKARSYPPMQEYVYHLSDKTSIRDFLVGFSESLGIIDASRTYAVSVSDYYLRSQLGIDGTFLHRHLKRYRLESDVRDILKAHPHILLAHDPSDVPLNYAQTVDIIQDKYVVCDALVDEPNLLIRKYTHPLMDCDHEPSSITMITELTLWIMLRITTLLPNGFRHLSGGKSR